MKSRPQAPSVATLDASTAEPPPLRTWPRFALLIAAWTMLYAAGPGIVTPAGEAWLVPLGIALWSLAVSRPGPRAFFAEWIVSGVAWCGICSWAALTHWGSMLFIGPGMGLYFACTGKLARALARRWTLAVAIPAAWVGVEALRSWLEPPYGLPWMRLGTHLHDAAWISGSARVWGFGGLSYALAASGGLLADLWRAWQPASAGAKRGTSWRWAVALGAGPLASGAALALLTHSPAVADGPSILLAQPNVPQENKMRGLTAEELFAKSWQQTAAGMDDARRRGEPPPDLVAWGESMFGFLLVDRDLVARAEAGLRPLPWSSLAKDFDVDRLRQIDEGVQPWIESGLFGRGSKPELGILPPGTCFAAGVEVLREDRGAIRRQNAVMLWDAEGHASEPIGKIHLVPGAEMLLGLEQYEWARKIIFAVAGYTPDLAVAKGPRTLRFQAHDGREFVFGASVCFDNAFDDPYTQPLREGRLDFHLVVSNEAWFLHDQEFDQMLAFSRLIAIETGRSIARATNTGVSCVIDPDGRTEAHLRVDGSDRQVGGFLRAVVPVPVAMAAPRSVAASAESAASADQPLTFFVRFEHLWRAVWLALPLALLAAARFLRMRGGRPLPEISRR